MDEQVFDDNFNRLTAGAGGQVRVVVPLSTPFDVTANVGGVNRADTHIARLCIVEISDRSSVLEAFFDSRKRLGTERRQKGHTEAPLSVPFSAPLDRLALGINDLSGPETQWCAW